MLTETEKQMLEARADMGFADATRAPEWAARRIAEVRSAILANRPIPPITPADEDQTLKRVLARQGREIAAARWQADSVVAEDAANRARLVRIGEEIRRQALEY